MAVLDPSESAIVASSTRLGLTRRAFQVVLSGKCAANRGQITCKSSCFENSGIRFNSAEFTSNFARFRVDPRQPYKNLLYLKTII